MKTRIMPLVQIGGHASTMFSNSMTSERSKSDSTTIGFTLSDDDVGDQVGRWLDVMSVSNVSHN